MAEREREREGRRGIMQVSHTKKAHGSISLAQQRFTRLVCVFIRIIWPNNCRRESASARGRINPLLPR